MTSRSMIVEETLARFPNVKVMFHVLGEGSESQDLQEGSEIRRRKRRDTRDEIFRETTAEVAPQLDLEGCACVCMRVRVWVRVPVCVC